MNEFFISFTVGFLCTLTLFALCFLIVLGAKVFLSTFSRYFNEKLTPEPIKPTPVRIRKPKTVNPTPKPVKSIEIDPLEIDRIYVKKSS